MPGARHEWPDVDTVAEIVAQASSWEKVAERMGKPRSTVQAFCRRHKIAAPNTRKERSFAFDSTVDVPDEAELGKVRELIVEEGLNPDEWIVSRIRLNRYGDQEQRRVDLTPREDVLLPVRSDGWRPPRKARVKPSEGRVGLFPDQHAPFHDPLVHEAACQWIRDAKPSNCVPRGPHRQPVSEPASPDRARTIVARMYAGRL